MTPHRLDSDLNKAYSLLNVDSLLAKQTTHAPVPKTSVFPLKTETSVLSLGQLILKMTISSDVIMIYCCNTQTECINQVPRFLL